MLNSRAPPPCAAERVALDQWAEQEHHVVAQSTAVVDASHTLLRSCRGDRLGVGEYHQEDLREHRVLEGSSQHTLTGHLLLIAALKLPALASVHLLSGAASLSRTLVTLWHRDALYTLPRWKEEI